MSGSTNLKDYTGQNPFKDHQARMFDSQKLLREFCPTSRFWSLFNDQHEVLIGRRGSGKTILLKMMRYSLLSKIKDQRAIKIIEEKKYISIFAPTYLEFLGSFIHQTIPPKEKLLFFQFAFNCLLARSFLYEISAIIDEESDIIKRGVLSNKIAKIISEIWFPKAENRQINTIEDLTTQIIKLYENCNIQLDKENIPRVFQNTICRPIQAVSQLIYKELNFSYEPTWIICIDEAEFIPKELQRCFNSLFRADSKNIVIKMATLPYRHETTETLIDNIFAESNGNDFSYRKVDMDFNSDDFVNVTNNLVKTRLQNIELEIKNKDNISLSLEGFLGKIGEDDLIDYYKEEMKDDSITRESIEKRILSKLSDQRQKKASETINFRKTHYDKFAPIFFTREMFHLSTNGNTIPGWYAGAKMVRKISDGNPRIFIRIMNLLFEKARKQDLKPKAQHVAVYDFSKQECNATKSLPIYGPDLYYILDSLANKLKEKVHGDVMIFSGNSFQIKNKNIQDNKNLIESLKLGVAYCRVNVDDGSYFSTINNDTKFTLSNTFSAYYWIPIRKGDYPKLLLPPKQTFFNF
jgi:hypothetical protein